MLVALALVNNFQLHKSAKNEDDHQTLHLYHCRENGEGGVLFIYTTVTQTWSRETETRLLRI
jgi:hypothetical protein